MKYICTSDFYVDMRNEMCCFIPRKRLHVPKDSMETSEDNYLDLPDGIHLNRIWKTKNTKTYPWIEFSSNFIYNHFGDKPTKKELLKEFGFCYIDRGMWILDL